MVSVVEPSKVTVLEPEVKTPAALTVQLPATFIARFAELLNTPAAPTEKSPLMSMLLVEGVTVPATVKLLKSWLASVPPVVSVVEPSKVTVLEPEVKIPVALTVQLPATFIARFAALFRVPAAPTEKLPFISMPLVEGVTVPVTVKLLKS